MDRFVQKVRQTMDTHHMLETNEPVLAALSGGADSVALLLALRELGIPVSACHLHHGLRGAEADRDEQFCRQPVRKAWHCADRAACRCGGIRARDAREH